MLKRQAVLQSVHAVLIDFVSFSQEHHRESVDLFDCYGVYFLRRRSLGSIHNLDECMSSEGSIPSGVGGFFIDIKSFRSHYDPGVDSASNKNEYQEQFLWLKAAGT